MSFFGKILEKLGLKKAAAEPAPAPKASTPPPVATPAPAPAPKYPWPYGMTAAPASQYGTRRLWNWTNLTSGSSPARPRPLFPVCRSL